MLVNRKIKDSDLAVSTGSRADRYWKDRGFEVLYKNFRTPQLRHGSEDPYISISKKYKVRAIEFGNWVSIEMRYNYLIASIIAADDIKKSTGLSSFGYGVLSLAFGARGTGSALAHYEPYTDTINITRFSRGENFASSGGVGSMAHEYGHFLDYYFGVRAKNKSGSRALSGGHRTVTAFTDEELKDPGAWGCMSRVLKAIMWNKDTHSAYFTRVKEFAGDNDYWYRRNELFARAFEQYVQAKLQRKKIANAFLTKQRKYDAMGKVYMKPEEFKKIIPLIDKLMKAMKRLK